VNREKEHGLFVFCNVITVCTKSRRALLRIFIYWSRKTKTLNGRGRKVALLEKRGRESDLVNDGARELIVADPEALGEDVGRRSSFSCDDALRDSLSTPFEDPPRYSPAHFPLALLYVGTNMSSGSVCVALASRGLRSLRRRCESLQAPPSSPPSSTFALSFGLYLY